MDGVVGGSDECWLLALMLMMFGVPLPLLLLPLRTAAEDLGLRFGLGWMMGGPGTARGAGTGKGGMMGGSLFSVAGVGGAFWQVWREYPKHC